MAALEVDTSTSGTQWGTGGMATKLTAARIATASGCTMVICHSDRPDAIERIIAGEALGTVFRPVALKMTDRKRWILSGARWLQLILPVNNAADCCCRSHALCGC